MKKLPILLLTLILASTWPVGDAMATSLTEMPVLNQLDSRFHIQVIRPREGIVEVEIQSPMGSNLRIRRVWLATFDYENGWTETEVDALLDEWTELEAEWTRVTKEQIFGNMAEHSYATIPLTIGDSRLQYDLTEVNWSDILYYAVEFRDLNDEAAESVWARGKVDYRGCVHAKLFEEWATGVCEEMVDWEAGVVKYWASGATDDEEVVTWEEEWRQKLAGRLDEIEVVLDGLAMLPEVAESDLTGQEERLAKLEALLAKATGVEAEVEQAVELRERIAGLRRGDVDNTDMETGGDEAGSGDGDGEGGNGGSENGGSGGGANGGSDSSVSDNNSAASGSEETGRFEETGGAVSGDDADRGGNWSGATVRGEDVGDYNNREGESEANTEDTVKSEEKLGLMTSTKEVEVPKLGGEESRNGWIWWLLGAVGGLALILVVVLKRKRDR